MTYIVNFNMRIFSSSRNNNSCVPYPGNMSFWLIMFILTSFTCVALYDFSKDPVFYEFFISDLERDIDIPDGFTYVPATIRIDPSLLETPTTSGVMDDSQVNMSPLINYLIVIKFALALAPFVVFGFFFISAVTKYAFYETT